MRSILCTVTLIRFRRVKEEKSGILYNLRYMHKSCTNVQVVGLLVPLLVHKEGKSARRGGRRTEKTLQPQVDC